MNNIVSIVQIRSINIAGFRYKSLNSANFFIRLLFYGNFKDENEYCTIIS